MKFVPCGIETQYKITPAQLEAAITPKTRMFMFSSPCNPTGSVYSAAELEAPPLCSPNIRRSTLYQTRFTNTSTTWATTPASPASVI
ncbi:aminotransferase class I/II-fold pyridoxal phosphate-dependent enzyme [Chitinophaga sedimenti]|nr:aminotransferase class I/II-fold pyridoxal phosphate-dependent enzyme [Chitinophaga sedimenti]